MMMRFNQGLDWLQESATFSIAQRVQSLKAQGVDIIDLSVGEPDALTPMGIQMKAIDAMRAGKMRYSPVGGQAELKNSVAQHLWKNLGLRYKSDEILVTSGAKQAITQAIQSILNPEDEVILPTPYWVSYPAMIRLAGGKVVPVECRLEEGFKLPSALLEQRITPKTQLIILNSPHNPTGVVYTEEDWQQLAAILARFPNVWLLLDEIYEGLYWGPGNGCPRFLKTYPEFKHRTLWVSGCSKNFAMTGWRIGYAAGPAELIKKMTALQSQWTSGANTIAQHAAVFAIEHEQAFPKQLSQQYSERSKATVAFLNAIPGIQCAAANGAFYLFPRIQEALDQCRPAMTDLEFAGALLDDFGVAVVPGSAFGAPGHCRLSLTQPIATLERACQKIGQFFEVKSA